MSPPSFFSELGVFGVIGVFNISPLSSFSELGVFGVVGVFNLRPGK
ncbi:hypothetical protein [Oceanimonas baumannii]|nr:hypothetical protein [Oceanimonas baumannii]